MATTTLSEIKALIKIDLERLEKRIKEIRNSIPDTLTSSNQEMTFLSTLEKRLINSRKAYEAL